MNKKLCFLLGSLFFFLVSLGQETAVSGKVTSGNETLAGVIVIVKGKAGLGVITDSNGNYQIQALANDTLIFSYLGFKAANWRL